MTADGAPLPGSVSVIIPTCDRPSLLDEALRSVASQDETGLEVVVVVVNDGSTPVTEVVDAWRTRLGVRLVDLGGRRGAAAARNAGLESSRSKFVAFLDDDDLFLPDHLARCLVPLRRGEADFVYSAAIVLDRRFSGRLPPLAVRRVKAYPYSDAMLLAANFLHTGSVVVRSFRRTAVRFDETLDVCEDWDLWLALTSTLGYRVHFLGQVTSIYHQTPDVPGLVAAAQAVSPSRFALARRYIQEKWPTSDPLALSLRAWLDELELVRSQLVGQGQTMPNLLFDEVLSYLHACVAQGERPDSRDIHGFFT